MNAEEKIYKIIETYWMLWFGFCMGAIINIDPEINGWQRLFTAATSTAIFTFASFITYYFMGGWFEDKKEVVKR